MRHALLLYLCSCFVAGQRVVLWLILSLGVVWGGLRFACRQLLVWQYQQKAALHIPYCTHFGMACSSLQQAHSPARQVTWPRLHLSCLYTPRLINSADNSGVLQLHSSPRQTWHLGALRFTWYTKFLDCSAVGPTSGIASCIGHRWHNALASARALGPCGGLLSTHCLSHG
jgi:hypothetical protein